VLEEAVKAMPANDEMKLALVDFTVRAGTPAEGERVLRALVAKEPDNYTLQLALGTLLEGTNRSKEAIAAYEEVVRRAGTGPQGLTARNRLAAIALAQGRLDEASRRNAEVLAKNPRDSDALLLHGRLALARHDAPGAIADFRAILRDQPKATVANQLLADAHVANHEWPLALEALRNAVAAAPGDTSLKIELAQLLAQSGDADASIALLEETVRATPADAAAREALTRAYLRKGDNAAALTAAQDLKTLRPDSGMGSYLAGLAAAGQDHPEDAQKEFEHALALQPGAVDVLSALARLEFSRGRQTEAIARVKKEIARDPKAVAPLVLLGQLYMAQNDAPAAVAALTQATTLAPQWWVSYRELARARLLANDVPGAVSAYQGAIKVEPSEPLLTTELAGLYLQQGRTDEAIASYESFNRQHPHVQLIENNLAMLLVTYRNDPVSLDRARDLTAGFASSNDGSLLDTNGWVHFKRAEYQDALPVLERAVERSPQSPEIRYHLGMAELQTGHKDRARSNLETAVSGSAKFTGADEARSTLEALKKG
jgi:predicted Zn-dependent protease